jgi:hypothetical protein
LEEIGGWEIDALGRSAHIRNRRGSLSRDLLSWRLEGIEALGVTDNL